MKYKYLILPTQELSADLEHKLLNYKDILEEHDIDVKFIIELGIHALNRLNDRRLYSVGVSYTPLGAVCEEIDTFIVTPGKLDCVIEEDVIQTTRVITLAALKALQEVSMIFDRAFNGLDIMDSDLLVEDWDGKDVIVYLRNR